MRPRTPFIALVTCLLGAAWGCGDGETVGNTTATTTHPSRTTTATKDGGSTGAGGGTGACVTAGGEVYVSPAGGTCDLEVIKKVPGCNEKQCQACTVPLNCLPICCVCDDGVHQYAATGCLNKSGNVNAGKCMTADDVCLDQAARDQGCALPQK